MAAQAQATSIETRLDIIESTLSDMAAAAAMPKDVTTSEGVAERLTVIETVIKRAIGGWASEMLDELEKPAVVVDPAVAVVDPAVAVVDPAAATPV